MAAAAALALACAAVEEDPLAPIVGCEGDGELTPICQFQAPEDLQLLPGGRALLIGEYGGNTGRFEGSLKAMTLSDQAITTLYPHPSDAAVPEAADSGEMWGDPACPGPPGERFATHGLHVSVRSDGRTQVHVVNHVDRESIEFFELRESDEGFTAQWRGCAVAPEPYWLNDVVGLRDGGFIATHMIDRGSDLSDIQEALREGTPAGYVVEWSAQRGWERVEGSEGGLGNGIEISPDERILYINFYAGGEVVAFDRGSGERLWTAAVSQPDNTSWTPDRKLLVASHDTPLEDTLAFIGVHDKGCPLPFSLVVLDPVDGTQQILVDRAGPPMGGVTTAVHVGDDLYLGSFSGDRLGRLRHPEAPAVP